MRAADRGGPHLRTGDVESYRRAMARFATGVTVVSSVDRDGRPQGMTVNSLASVSLDPLLLLVCLTRDSRTYRAVRHSNRFAVSVLGSDQREIAERFARDGVDHFDAIRFEWSDAGLPMIPDRLASVQCDVRMEQSAGDHVVVYGDAVEHEAVRRGRPLLFLDGELVGFPR